MNDKLKKEEVSDLLRVSAMYVKQDEMKEALRLIDIIRMQIEMILASKEAQNG